MRDRTHPKTYFVARSSEKAAGKAEVKNARRRALLHVENVFGRQRSIRPLQPIAVDRGFGMGSSLFVLILTAALLSATGCEQPATSRKPQPDSQSAADNKPLLLLDDTPQTEQSDGPTADNNRCFVCHINYMQEDIAVTHARADMGCARCHGESDEHIADESWASGGNGTAPDIMYPRDKINPFCLTCHSKESIPAKEHEALFAGTAKKKYCTDCHGEHRLTERKCKWK